MTSHLHPFPTHDTLVYSTQNLISLKICSLPNCSCACSHFLLHKFPLSRLCCWEFLNLSNFMNSLHRITIQLSSEALRMFLSMIMSLMRCLVIIGAFWQHNCSFAFFIIVGKITLGKSFFPSHESLQYTQSIGLFLLRSFFVANSFAYFRTVNYHHINSPNLLKWSFKYF